MREPENPSDAASQNTVATLQFEIAQLSDIGNDRANNEDACGHWIEASQMTVFAVADGVGGYEGGEVASRMAVDITLEAYRESPAAWGSAKRLQRAVQRANIEIYNLAITVPELRRMATTLTAAAVSDGVLTAMHVGDCRLYHLRSGKIAQITKDHTLVGERVRMGLLSAREARSHPERSALSRCLGRELIVSVDRISMPLRKDDAIILCSDGLYSVLEDHEIANLVAGADSESACRKLIEGANQRGTADNVTSVVFRLLEGGAVEVRTGLRARLQKLFRGWR